MPPRSSVRLAAEAEVRASSALAPLPLSVAQSIFASLPPDSRARAACVCRSWRRLLADPALWTTLVLATGSFDATINDAVLRGASGRACGQLRCLDVFAPSLFTPRVLSAVLAANASSLRELRVSGLHMRRETLCPTLEAMLQAAPRLRVLDAASVTCNWEDAPRLLQSEAPLTPLRLRGLRVQCGDGEDLYGPPGGADRVSPLLAALADAALQPTLTGLTLLHADTRLLDVANALADAALTPRLRSLKLSSCTPPAAAPLAHLLRTSSLATFEYAADEGAHARLADAAGAALVAEALRASTSTSTSTSLTSFSLSNAGVCADPRVAASLLGALLAHPTLKTLALGREHITEPAALGAALGALVAADAPALQNLHLIEVALEDEGWAPLAAALRRNHHLRGLYAFHTDMTPEFARTQLLPAVRENESLRELLGNDGGAALDEASNLVVERPPVSGWVSTW